jgi:hypothetical protein
MRSSGLHARNWLAWLVVPVTLGVTPAGAFAQGAERAVLVGTITDVDGHPLPGVFVDFSGSKRHARTDDRGHFRMDKLPTDSLIMIVRRVGLVPMTFDLLLVPGENIVTIRMEQVSQVLDAVRSAVAQTGLFGVVGDTAYDIVAGATVSTVVHKATTVTNQKGQFSFDPVQTGADMVDVRKVGFRPRLVSFTMPPKGGQRVAIWLTPLPPGLDAAALRRASRPSNALVQELFDFRLRRLTASSARSMFATREQLAQYAIGMLASDALRYLPRFGTVRADDIACVIIDGVMALGSTLYDFSTNEIETLEVTSVRTLQPQDAKRCLANAPGSFRPASWAAFIMLRH